MKTGIELIAAERERQISQEGWTPEHDSQWDNNELFYAARCYHESAHLLSNGADECKAYGIPLQMWPWDAKWFKVPDTVVRVLVKAGALYRAELDRLEGNEISKHGLYLMRVCRFHERLCALEIDRIQNSEDGGTGAIRTPNPISPTSLTYAEAPTVKRKALTSSKSTELALAEAIS